MEIDLKKVRKELMEKDTQLMVIKHKQAVELSKK